MSVSPPALIIKSMDTPHTARLARRISAASMDSAERSQFTGSGARAAYSVRCANRADRQLTRQALSALTR